MATAWCHWRILPSGSIVRESVLLMFRESNGNLRWFAVLGAVLGMYLYHRTLSPLLVKYISGFLNMLLNPIHKALRISVRWVKRS